VTQTNNVLNVCIDGSIYRLRWSPSATALPPDSYRGAALQRPVDVGRTSAHASRQLLSHLSIGSTIWQPTNAQFLEGASVLLTRCARDSDTSCLKLKDVDSDTTDVGR